MDSLRGVAGTYNRGRSIEELTIRRFGPIRLIALLAFASFLGAAEGQAYGLRTCPVHDAPASPHGTGPDSGAPHAPAPHSDGGHDRGDGADGLASAGHHSSPGSEGSCTCIDDCHVGSSTAGPASNPAAIASGLLPPLVLGSMANAGDLRGPRHRLFELHLPNAPPV